MVPVLAVSFPLSATIVLLMVVPDDKVVRVVGREFCWCPPAAIAYAGPVGGCAGLVFAPRWFELPFEDETLKDLVPWLPNELVLLEVGVVTGFEAPPPVVVVVVVDGTVEVLDGSVEFCNMGFDFLGDGAGCIGWIGKRQINQLTQYSVTPMLMYM